MIKSFRDITLTIAELEALKHLLATARRKKQYACLIANLYDSRFTVDIRFCMTYLSGEGGDTRLKDAVLLVLRLAEQGIESHEYFGQETVEDLIAKWSMRELD
ncbi:hypothetical protein SAMN02744133_10810 [Thalassospira xiamenensis M-5 = DSM 17429]|uniref:Uncharacterized protein n=1 Tax=Thalassospira xiamenensis M-5 = DSM 17429 TaxID=1123366 RepID=A0AB72UJL9_9PROT|nr:hypothetical protein [Thalassospira xiamenensis]AJD54290.1 hypothetical protein TH3_21088 [Thalassospira xiamenensis M-5 = DSM 17429]SIT20854.1 hypothetical protein SAMN02744133_10810 [Thalassospira xiamenensis M-5 = DSM 17429]